VGSAKLAPVMPRLSIEVTITGAENIAPVFSSWNRRCVCCPSTALACTFMADRVEGESDQRASADDDGDLER
jgi:hypothetical protein